MKEGVGLVLATALASAPLAYAQAPSTDQCIAAYEEGQVKRDEGQLLDARARFIVCAREECPQALHADCRAWRLAVELRVPTVMLKAVGDDGQDRADVTVSIDDGPPRRLDGRPIELDPGSHEIAWIRAGALLERQTVLLVEGERGRVISLRVPAPALVQKEPTTDPVQRVPTRSWVLGGLGLAALTGFAVLGVGVDADERALRDTCAPACPRAEAESLRTRALLADGLLLAGVGAVIVAGWWAFGTDVAGAEPEGPGLTIAPGGGVLTWTEGW